MRRRQQVTPEQVRPRSGPHSRQRCVQIIINKGERLPTFQTFFFPFALTSPGTFSSVCKIRTHLERTWAGFIPQSATMYRQRDRQTDRQRQTDNYREKERVRLSRPSKQRRGQTLTPTMELINTHTQSWQCRVVQWRKPLD